MKHMTVEPLQTAVYKCRKLYKQTNRFYKMTSVWLNKPENEFRRKAHEDINTSRSAVDHDIIGLIELSHESLFFSWCIRFTSSSCFPFVSPVWSSLLLLFFSSSSPVTAFPALLVNQAEVPLYSDLTSCFSFGYRGQAWSSRDAISGKKDKKERKVRKTWLCRRMKVRGKKEKEQIKQMASDLFPLESGREKFWGIESRESRLMMMDSHSFRVTNSKIT